MELWAIILCASAGALLLAVFVLFTLIFFKQFARRDDGRFDTIDLHGTHYEPYIDKINQCIKRLDVEEKQPLTLTSRDGKKLYAEYFYRGKSRTAVMVHGLHSTPYNNFAYLTGRLLDEGYNVLFIFNRCHQKSEGKLIRLGQKEQYDVLDWIDFIAKDARVKDILVYGTSMGASTVGYLSDKVKNPKVKVLCMDCGFTSFFDLLLTIFHRPIDRLLGVGLPVFWFWGRITGMHLFRSTVKSLRRTSLPVYFIHGTADGTVALSHTLKAYEACAGEKKLVTVEGAGHTASMLVGGEKILDEFIEFTDKYTRV